jgi:4a-hydroxytetrahydrobiopterin dehydratase
MSSPLPKSEIKSALAELPGWAHEADGLTKIFKFGSFREAVSFMLRAAFEAEEMNHHPDWTNVYDKVIVRLTSHDAGDKVTVKDVDLARRLQQVSWVG